MSIAMGGGGKMIYDFEVQLWKHLFLVNQSLLQNRI